MITDISRCEAAARALDLSVTTAVDNNLSRVSPGCIFHAKIDFSDIYSDSYSDSYSYSYGVRYSYVNEEALYLLQPTEKNRKYSCSHDYQCLCYKSASVCT